MRILYIMNVDWCWAKQRPHFLAEHLSKFHQLKILYPFAWRRHNLAVNLDSGLNLIPLFRLPFSRFINLFKFLNHKTSCFFLKKITTCFEPQIIWITSSELIDIIPENFTGQIIYDCMDDIIEFPENFNIRDKLVAIENNLIKRSDLVICSSAYLKNKLTLRSKYNFKCIIINNAINGNLLLENVYKKNNNRNIKIFKIGYSGTISSWFDFESVLAIIEKFDFIEFHLIGPVNKNIKIPKIKNKLIFYGHIPYQNLSKIIINFDALIMPFNLSELIKSVDPVKLYEYIYFNKPIISIKYDELEKFSKFIHFYSTQDELIRTISEITDDNYQIKYSTLERLNFLSKNTWADRVLKINNEIDNLFV